MRTHLFGLSSALLCCLVAFASPVLAQKVQFRLTVKNITPIATKTFYFTVAADPAGTDSLDSDLGEVEIPDIPLPGDIFYVWTIAPTQAAMWLSPLDVRRYEQGVPTKADHDLRVNWNGGKLEIGWSGPLPAEIDSMYITDGFSDFPNNIVKTKVGPGTVFSTENPAINRFRVLVWYNGATTSVSEFVTNQSDYGFYPNPVHEVLHFAHSGQFQELSLLNAQGVVLRNWVGDQLPDLVSFNDFASGVYMMKTTNAHGEVSLTPIVHH